MMYSAKYSDAFFWIVKYLPLKIGSYCFQTKLTGELILH